ncbi:hypothetical protein ILUMI_17126 [Ignelater luminosus]|uniref:Carboxypeptidase n=1 Tax=Ignelater luminosus TaxID=2038154 RepID=A0A8K0G5B7_IGNLU|nr:hypothetical protein ILUMI_17126 [Ignelater luminosus]
MSTDYLRLSFYILLAAFCENKRVCGINEEIDKKPLIVTTYIREGKTQEARKLSQVDPRLFNGTRSYSGFFTVDQQHHSNLFFWFFPSQTEYLSASLILWLDGGPGESNVISIFSGIGPLRVNSNGTVETGEYSCSKHHSVLYIDNPVGTGYSFTDQDGYANNQTVIGEQLYEALTQFFQLFPEIKKNSLYVFGESYGGKFVPALSYTVHVKNKNAQNKINLKGLIIGNSWTDPKHQSTYSDISYQVGLIDFNTKLEFIKYENTLQKLIDRKQWKAASEYWDRFIRLPGSLFWNITGYEGTHNFLVQKFDMETLPPIHHYVQKPNVRNALHVGNLSFVGHSDMVFEGLRADIMQSVAPWLSELLDHYRVMIFTGQLDIMVSYTMTVNFLRRLKFKGVDEYHTAVRQKWYVDETLAGYIKEIGNLTEVLVLNAEHAVHFSKPYWTVELVTKFIHREKLH